MVVYDQDGDGPRGHAHSVSVRVHFRTVRRA
jgi:hypothetical protein